jgi:cytochrome c553
MPSRIAKLFPLALLALVGITTLIPLGRAQKPGAEFSPGIPKVWDDAAVRSWSLPLAGLGEPPTYVSADYYYRMPERIIYRTYPVYTPDKEPRGYLNWLKQQEPEIAFDPAKLKTEADWIKAGEMVFNAPDVAPLWDSVTVERLRDPAYIKAIGVPVAADGTLPQMRYSISRKGEVRPVFTLCAGCHARVLPNGKVIVGAQGNRPNGKRIAHHLRSFGEADWKRQPPSLFASASVPWLSPDPAERLKNLSFADYLANVEAVLVPGVQARVGTSFLYPVKTPDLIGIRERKYLDATGFHLHRNIGDLMRYAASIIDVERFIQYGKYRVGETPPEPPTRERLSEAQLYALARYIYSLKPPVNPNKPSALARRGAQVFERAGCVMCHTPPLYTSNKLTPAEGFTIPAAHKTNYDILPVPVGTDTRLALQSRKGTGYYKVPSLKGVWYRGPFEHNGSVATLEDWFDPNRLKDDYVPTGFKGYGVKTRAVQGHEFGLKLSVEDKQALIAFLKTL